nr:MAG TPA: hypothetical protein [Bacteriophage sp.]
MDSLIYSATSLLASSIGLFWYISIYAFPTLLST